MIGNGMRTATALAVILSVMPPAVSTAWAESTSPPPTPPAPQSPSLFPFSFPSLSQFQFWDKVFDAHRGYWSGSLEFDYMNGRQSTSSANGGASTSTNSGMRETMKIENRGFYILSPKLCTGNMALDLKLNQDKSGSSGGGTVAQGNVIGYAIDATFLAEKPYPASVFANRNQFDTLQSFGGRTVGVNENQGALFHLRENSILNDWGFHWVEANLGISQDHNQSTTTSFGHSQTSDEKSQTLDFDASKGFETADLGFNYKFNDRSNQTFRQGNFQSQVAGLQYSLDFGPTGNRRFDSRLNFMTRNGSAPSTTISNNEHLHIDHFRNLNTDYQYSFAHQKFGDISTTQQNGAFSMAHQLYKNLNTTAGLIGSYNTLSAGTTTAFGGHLGQGYQHSLPGKGNLSLQWSGGYRLNSNNLSASNISVIEEAHSAPNPFGAGVGFLLDHNFAVASSIVVTNVRGGGRSPTFVSVDYVVINESNQIKIVPLPTAGIFPGDPLVVSYNYQADTNTKYATKSAGFGMLVDYHWISAAFNHQQSEQTPLSGTSLFLQNTRQDSVQVNLQGSVLKMAANASMGFDNYKSTTSAYQRSKLGSTLIWEIQSNMKMIFGVNASETQYSVPDQRKSSFRSARSSLDWFTADGWNNTASIDWSNNKDGSTPAETLVQAIGQSSITLGQLSLRANLALGEWLRNGNRSTNRSFNISIVRQF